MRETTNEVTYTPGPWTVKRIDYEPCHPDERARDVSLEILAGQQFIAQTIMREVQTEAAQIATDEANARLIAAAPDLLESLKAIMEQFDAGALCRNTDSDGCSDWALKAAKPLAVLAKAKAAIAKADRGGR